MEPINITPNDDKLCTEDCERMSKPDYDISAIQSAHKIEKANEIHNKLVDNNMQKILQTISKTELSEEDIKLLEDGIVKLESVNIDRTNVHKLKSAYINNVYKKGIGKPKKQYKLAIIDENNNIVLELKNLENIVKIANLAKEI
jgi:hypothetical protein